MGRAGLTAAFGLSYNSQNWRLGSTTTEVMGVDTGYGFGWQLMLGSLLPVYGGSGQPVPLQYYLFTDSTGAQYRLNQQNGSVWSSSESVYIWYDTNTNLLHFRNGMFWLMGCASAGTEPDAGTFYPTVVEDSNGNQIIVHYLPGSGAYWNDSSARIGTIEDARAALNAYELSYGFTYVTGGNGLSNLSGITNYVGTLENYTFTIHQGQPLYSPTSPGVSFGTTVLSRLFRRLFLEALIQAHADGQLRFFGDLESLRGPSAFAAYLAPVSQAEWVVYAKPPFGGPQQVIEYLGRYTHRVAISNQRLVALQEGQVSFRWKDYRHPQEQKVMTVSAEEFIRRFLLHALPPGFQRIRYYGLLANRHRAGKLQLCRQRLAAPLADLLPVPKDYRNFYAALTGKNLRLCPECGMGTMVRIELLPPCQSAVGLRMDSS